MSVSPDVTRQNGTGSDMPQRFDPLSEIGTMGVVRAGGYVDDEILTDLRGDRKKRIIRQMMMNDATIGALLYALKYLVRQTAFRVEDGGTTNMDQRAGDLVRTSLFDDMSISWRDLLSDMVSFLPWGWSWHETVYKYRDGDNRDPSRRSQYNDGLIGWRKWAIRSQETLVEWVFDENGGTQAMVQAAAPDYTSRTIPIEKSLHFKTESNRGNPEGISILRTAYRAWRIKTRIENLEGIGLERDLAGIPVAFLPSKYMSENATAQEKALYNHVKKIVSSVRRDEHDGLVLPYEYDDAGHLRFDFKLLSSAGQRQFDTSKIIERWDNRILMSVLADFIMLGSAEVGSFALSSDKTDLFAVATGAHLDTICGVVNQHAIPRLIRLNPSIRVEAMPRLVHADIESEDVEMFAEALSKLLTAGAITPDDKVESRARALLNIEQAEMAEREVTA